MKMKHKWQSVLCMAGKDMKSTLNYKMYATYYSIYDCHSLFVLIHYAFYLYKCDVAIICSMGITLFSLFGAMSFFSRVLLTLDVLICDQPVLCCHASVVSMDSI